MTRRERVLAALRGDPVDHVPLSFWLHNFATENSAAALADETLRMAAAFGWDYLKPQSRAQCFAEMWGLTYRPSTERAMPYTVTREPLVTADDVARVRAVDPHHGALGEQLEALKAIRARVGADVPIIWTVFSPLMVLPFLVRGGKPQVFALLRADGRAVERGLAAIAETLTAYARACLAAGADGLFYATNVATRALTTAEECRRFQRPFDRQILDAVAGAPFTLLHVCGDDVLFDEFVDYPVTAFSWAAVPGNPSLKEGHRMTGRPVVGGLPAKPEIASMTSGTLVARAAAAIAEMSGRWLLLGPECSVNPDTPEALFHAVGKAVQGNPQSPPLVL
jgi:uroporphyrinogen decarboxylase